MSLNMQERPFFHVKDYLLKPIDWEEFRIN